MPLQLFYTSAKYIRVQHNVLAILYYIVQVLLLAYVALYQIWLKGGYQKQSPFSGAVDVKVKGSGYLGDSFDTCGTEGTSWYVVCFCTPSKLTWVGWRVVVTLDLAMNMNRAVLFSLRHSQMLS